jgi:beta-glucanase (GH16 family)
MHDYEIDWQPDTITWSIDGKVVRTLDRESTWNATSNRYSYPQTPCQVQLSLWPAGLPSNGEGTIEWGGGLVTWDSPYMVNGYYYAAFESVEINCYDPPSGANVQGDASYIYTDSSMTNQSIEITDKTVVLGSLLGTGTNPGNSTSSDSPKSSNVATIPGLSGAGPGSDGSRGSNDTSGSGSSGSGDSGSGGSYTATGTGSAATGFVQGDDGSNGAAALGSNPEHALQGSLFAVVVAIVALCVL